ncbi:MAG TPA: DUF3606 domain-containing protein [Croceibacterium sp.]|jgi:hypothetical protein
MDAALSAFDVVRAEVVCVLSDPSAKAQGVAIMSNTQSDRSRVAASDPSEVRYFARKHGITDQQVLDLIKEVGNDRTKLEAAVAKNSVA